MKMQSRILSFLLYLLLFNSLLCVIKTWSETPGGVTIHTEAEERGTKIIPNYNQLNETDIEETDLEAFLDEQERRRAKVTDTCKQQKIKSNSKQSRIILDKTNKIGLCPIYKSASTSLIDMLKEIKGVVAPSLFTLMDLEKYFTVDVISLYRAKSYRDFTKFICVRHPLDRVLSAYRDKIENANKPWYYSRYGHHIVSTYRIVSPIVTTLTRKARARMLKEVLDAVNNGEEFSNLTGNIYAYPVGPTFQEFVKYLAKNPTIDEHWRPFYIQCKMCEMSYDFILKFESLESETGDLLKYLNQSHVKVLKKSANPNGTTDSVLCSYLATLKEEDFTALVQSYAYDFLLFGYDYESYAKCVKGEIGLDAKTVNLMYKDKLKLGDPELTEKLFEG